jgi:hypothetical protein
MGPTSTVGWVVCVLCVPATAAVAQMPATGIPLKTIEVPFMSHDGHAMFGKLTSLTGSGCKT